MALTSGNCLKIVDFWSHAVGRRFESRKRYRQPEAPRSRAAGIEVEDPANLFDLRYVGMARDNHVDVGASIRVKRPQIVQNVDRLPCETHEFAATVFAGPIASVYVSSDRGQRRNLAKRVNDLGLPNVASMNDVIHVR
jgi:hypothetical protein